MDKKYALEYSEGNDKLYDCLIKLWDKDFITIGCCKGHEEERKKQYIGFKIDNKDKIIKLLSALSKEDISITFTSSDNKKSTSIRKNKNLDIFDNILENIDGDKTANYINEIINYILDFNGKYLNIRIYYFNNKMSVYVNTSDDNLISNLKAKYKFSLLNENQNIYHFEIVSEMSIQK